MIIGTVKEIKRHENRVGLVPAVVQDLVAAGHRVLVERSAGIGSGISDDEYAVAGAEVCDAAKAVWSHAEMMVKVKEPQPSEWDLVRAGQIVFTYFHFAASLPLTEAMMRTCSVCVAYETVEDARGRLPLLTPMSEVAGRMAVQEGAKYLERPMQGRGILLGGVPGVRPADVCILGGGVVGANAAKIAAGIGASVSILDIDLDRLRWIDDVMPRNVTGVFSNPYTIRAAVLRADLVIGSVLVPGAKAPVLVPKAWLADMQPGAVVIDVAVDQGGCIETCRPTTHDDPVYVVDGIVHYCVANMPGAVGRTSTWALSNATGLWVKRLADHGLADCARRWPGFAKGVQMSGGLVHHAGVAGAFGFPCVPWKP
jgi:alanine dehydrogenase